MGRAWHVSKKKAGSEKTPPVLKHEVYKVYSNTLYSTCMAFDFRPLFSIFKNVRPDDAHENVLFKAVRLYMAHPHTSNTHPGPGRSSVGTQFRLLVSMLKGRVRPLADVAPLLTSHMPLALKYPPNAPCP